MKQNYIIFFILLFCISLTACKNRNYKEVETTPKLKMVEIPTIYSSQQEIESYVASHFWDTMDFSDSSYLQDKEALDLHYSSYINTLMSFPEQIAKKSIEKFTDSVLNATPPIKEYLLEIIELSLYDPNSRLRNECLYITVLNKIIQNPEFNIYLKERYREQLQIATKNRVGEAANNFEFTTIMGKKGSLYTLPKKPTLIMFYEPDCPACETSLEYLNNSNNIELASKSYNMIAVYTGDNMEKWEESVKDFKPYWTIAHDNNMVITIERLYDRRPSPSFYLLDKNRVVILKDALVNEIDFEISSTLKTK